MPVRRALIVPLVVALSGCVAGADTGRDQQPVIGGNPTPPGGHPAVGALMYDFGFGCTGTLIQPNVVLTAAHCVDPAVVGPQIPSFTLDHDAKGAPVEFAGAWIAVHEDFDVERDIGPGVGQFYDVGLLVLGGPIPGAQTMEMATPAEAAGLIAGLDVTIVGYGRTSNTSFDIGVKYDAVADLIALNESELQISVGAGAPQNCQGDSGGPGIVDLGAGPRLIGIVSRSAALDSDCDDGGIDSRVDHYRQWILDRIAAGCGAACDPPDPDAGLPDAAIADPDADPGPGLDDPDAGCCSTGRNRGGAGALLLAVAVLAALRKRRR